MTDHSRTRAELRHDAGQPRRLGQGRPPPLPRSGEPAPRPRRRRRRWLALSGYCLLALACALVAALTFFVVAAPVDFVRDQLVQQVKAHWGRDLVIAGPTSISLLPQVSVRLSDVSLSEPPGMGGGALLTAETFAIDVPLLALLSRQFAVKRLSERAGGYGIPGSTHDGNDVLEVYDAVGRAVDNARAGSGPTLLEFETFRMTGHSAHDDAGYVPKRLFEEWSRKDPILRLERLLADKRLVDPAAVAEMERRIESELDDAVAWAERQPYPEPSECLEGVYAD